MGEVHGFTCTINRNCYVDVCPLPIVVYDSTVAKVKYKNMLVTPNNITSYLVEIKARLSWHRVALSSSQHDLIKKMLKGEFVFIIHF